MYFQSVEPALEGAAMKTTKFLATIAVFAFLILTFGQTQQVNASPADAPAQIVCPQYTAKYFNNMTLSGRPALIRCETGPLDYDWGVYSPDPLINEDNISARWTRTAYFPKGTYIFHVETDDGVRVWIDGKLVINGWYDQAVTTYEVSQSFINAGYHNIRIDWYENGGDAVLRFWWMQ
jgi:hypothetical protein